MTMTDQSRENRDSFTPFPSTSWTLIRQAQDVSESRQKTALDGLLRCYWKPIYAFYRMKRQSPEDARELTQGFLLHFLKNQSILAIDKVDKKFRNWLKVSARNYLIDQDRRRNTEKRSPTSAVISFEALTAVDGAPFEPKSRDNLDAGFHDAWRRQVLQNALKTVQHKCHETGRADDFEIFQSYYCQDDDQRPTWQAVARQHGLNDWKAATIRADWVKAQLQKAIRSEIRNYVYSDEEVDDELADLLA